MSAGTQISRTRLGLIATGILSLLGAGCGSTAVMDTHPLLASSTDNAAKVYFLRTDPGFQGVMGNAFEITLGDQELLTIAKGEYTLVYLKPYTGELTVESTTVVNQGGMNTQIKVNEKNSFSFEPGNTYFISFQENNRGMMLGTSYIPWSITEDAARKIVTGLVPVGDAANDPL